MTDRKKGGGIDSYKRTFDFFPIFFVMEFYLIQAHKCFSIATIFVFKTRIAGLTPLPLE